jgi:hypothetical protein
MNAAKAITDYLQALEAGEETDQLRIDVVKAADEVFQTVQKIRLPYDQKWYSNERFIDGDHYLQVDRSTGVAKVTNDDALSSLKKNRVRRSINVVKPQIRGLKNFVLKTPLTVEFVPEDNSEEAVQAAQDLNRAWRGIEYALNLRQYMRDIVHDGFVKYAGYLGILPRANDLPAVHRYDGFDAYPDGTAPTVNDGRVFILATRQNLQAIKSNPDYENTAELQSDGRLAASEFKDSYERQKQGGQPSSTAGDLDSIILKQLFIRLPLCYRDITGPDGKPAKQLATLENGETHLWIVTTASNQLLRIEDTTLTKYPTVPYYPEKSGSGVFGNAWVSDLKAANKIIDNVMSIAEEWHLKAKPKLLVPTDSKLKEVKASIDVLEYNKLVPGDSIKDFMPQSLPASLFKLGEVARAALADMGGLHEASIGTVPIGVKSGKGIEALQAADAEFNIAEPLENFGLFFQEVAERIVELVSQNQIDQRTITYPDKDGVQKVTIIGEAGLVPDADGNVQVPEGVIVVRPSKARVTIVPEMAWTEEGKREQLREMYKDGLVPREYVLQAYRVSSVQEVAEQARREEMEKAKQPPPPKPVDADKLMNAFANIVKSGEPVTIEQLNAVMEQANLPPIPTPEPVDTTPLDVAA